MQETTTTDGPTVDVLALTMEERWAELARFSHLEDGRYHLSSIKVSAGIGSRDTHIDLEQLKALHRSLGRIVDGLDHPASHGSAMRHLTDADGRNVADLATTAGVDADALQRYVDGEGPLSHIAYLRVIHASLGAAATV